MENLETASVDTLILKEYIDDLKKMQREKLIEKLEQAIEYLDWYFYADDGMADKIAVKFYEILKKEIEKKTKSNN